MSVELFKVKKYPQTTKIVNILKVTTKPKVLENLKRSWEKVTEFEELKRARTLNNRHCCVRFGSAVQTDWDATTPTNSQQHVTGCANWTQQVTFNNIAFVCTGLYI